MNLPPLSLSNPNNWLLLAQEEHNAIQSPDGRFFQAIGYIVLPVLAESSVLAVRVSSSTAQPEWNLAGWFDVQAQNVASPISRVEVGTHRIALGEAKLIILPQISSSYRLRFKPAKWHRNVQIEVWEYVGDTKDVIEGKVDEVLTGIDEIQASLATGLSVPSLRPAVTQIVQEIEEIGGQSV